MSPVGSNVDRPESSGRTERIAWRPLRPFLQTCRTSTLSTSLAAKCRLPCGRNCRYGESLFTLGQRSISRRKRAACRLANHERNSRGFLKCLRRAAPSSTFSGQSPGMLDTSGAAVAFKVIDEALSDRDKVAVTTQSRPDGFREVRLSDDR